MKISWRFSLTLRMTNLSDYLSIYVAVYLSFHTIDTSFLAKLPRTPLMNGTVIGSS